MNITQKHRYTWLVDLIRRAGVISHNGLSKQWESKTALSGGRPLNRTTFRRWRNDIQIQFGITIACLRSGDSEYYIKNPEAFNSCPYLGELSRECLHRLKKEDIVDEYTIRRDLSDCLFYLGKSLILFKDYDEHWLDFMVCREFPYYIGHHMNKAEIEYVVNQLIEWFKVGYKPVVECIVDLAVSDLSKINVSERRLGLCDKKLVSIICDNSEKPYLLLKRHLAKVVVRKLFFKKANEGNIDYAYHLADYLYQKKRYKKAFDYFTEIEDDRYDVGRARHLGLMYFYGRGVIRDYDKAKEYLESHVAWLDPEETYALGEIYMFKGILYKAAELYRDFLIEPYGHNQSPYSLKVKERFIQIRGTFGIADWIIMTVRIGQNNRRCEFSVELPPFCRILLCWGEPRSCVYIYKSGKERRKTTFRHTYRLPGEYKIDFEVTCHHSVEAIEFCRYKKQLESIEFLTGRGLKKLSIIGQRLESLIIPPSEYLTGLICRSNNINSLDLSRCPKLTHLDCSNNPVSVLKLHRNSPLTKACVRNTRLDRVALSKILRANRGAFCNALDYESLVAIDMRLEYYFRCTSWDKTRKYLRIKLNHYYSHALTECECAFYKLREMARKNNRDPYKKGVLEMSDEYVSDDTIRGHEEFFLAKEPWSVSLAAKVRDMYRKEPWMRCEATLPEYYVACCLVNMILNDKEMKSAMRYLKCDF